MPRLLKDLQINDVSSVDRGAGEGVRVMLMKRHETTSPTEVAEYIKRKFSASERDAAASSGAALPDGSFPIKDKQDLKNAISLAGKAKDPAKAKAHIKARAKALGATDMLPDSWSKRDDNVIDMTGLLLRKDAHDFDTAQEVQETREAAWGMMDELNEAICALSCSVNSIMCDDGVVDKATAVAESFNQFQSYISGLKPEDMEKAMTPEQITKAINEAVAVAMKEPSAQIAKLSAENAFLKLSAAEQDFCKAFSDADKAAFIAKSAEDRAKEIEAKKKAPAFELPPEIQKRLLQADANEAIVKNLQERQEIADFEKKAVDLGLPKEKGELLRKARGGDAAAWTDLEKTMGELTKSLSAARDTGRIFSEFGTNLTRVGKAFDQLQAKADELRKADPKLTKEQAFTKAYTDPANKELVEQEKAERSAQRAA